MADSDNSPSDEMIGQPGEEMPGGRRFAEKRAPLQPMDHASPPDHAVYLLLQVRRFFLWDLRREFVRLEGFNGIKLVPLAVPI